MNAVLGMVRAELVRGGTAPADLDSLLSRLQNRLFDLGAELASRVVPDRGSISRAAFISDAHVADLEAAIDRHEAALEPLRAFILPGGAPAAAALHLARCVCRRAERRIVELAAEQPVHGEVLRFVNRLSDLLFVLARAVNRANRVADVIWPDNSG
jgi:cob(I)alamin adenosyltransferase